MPSSTSGSELAWQLYLDWCRATRRSPADAGDETLGEFFGDVPSAESTRRVRERSIRQRLGLDPPTSGPPDRTVGPSWRSEAEGAGVEESLSHTAASGWPSGLRGRRDAFLLVAIHQGLTRRQATRLTPDSITISTKDGTLVTLADTVVPTGAHPMSCPRCAVIRWLNALGLNRSWGRGVLRPALIRQQRVDSGHACGDRPQHTEWVNVPTLMPSIDKHGWIDEHQPISKRTVSTILARRQAELIIDPWPLSSGADAHRVGDLDTHHRPKTCGQEHVGAQLDRLSRLLDEMEDQAEAHEDLICRIEAEAEVIKRRASGK